PRLPVGLMNGDTYLDGTSPPFTPERVAAVIRHDATDDVVAALGPPSFPTGCAVDVDVDALAAGDWVELTCSARLSVGRGPIPTIVVTNLPPGIAKGDVGVAIAQRAESRIAHLRDRHAGHFAKLALPIGDVRDESSRDETRIVCELAEGTDVDDARDRLADTYGMVVRRHVQLRRPLAELVQQYTDADRDAQRTALQAVLDELGAASTG
ncbi:MAG TPA: hypothetical protein VFW74_01775, partial [Acidimicrobiia bacterium]|nr:hypothetical protein [Acidimicrobiia bacterium]